jgi:hypothetical protein
VIVHFSKHDLIARLGEPAEENVRPDPSQSGKMLSVLRWDCGCGAMKSQDDQLWEWEPGDCTQHRDGLHES